MIAEAVHNTLNKQATAPYYKHLLDLDCTIPTKMTTSNSPMKLELSIHACNLSNVAGVFRGKSDPFAVVTKIATNQGEQAQVLGKTETIDNTLNPNWVTMFALDYSLGTPMKIAISVFDHNKSKSHTGMGVAVFDVNEVLSARGNTKAKKLANGGTVFCSLRQLRGTGVIRFQLSAQGLKNTEGMFGKSDPFFELARRVEHAVGQSWDNVYRSKVVDNNLNPSWEEHTMQLSTLCAGDLDLPIELKVYDYNNSGKHVIMGRLETTVNALVDVAQYKTPLQLQYKGQHTGLVHVHKAQASGVQQSQPDNNNKTIQQDMANLSVTAGAPGAFVPGQSATPTVIPPPMSQPTFVDYVAGGLELNVVVAIDFTGSNGDPRKPGALHHMDDHSRNEYEKAMAAILSVLLQYDSDQRVPVLGFGAKYNGVVRHCFQCGPTPEVIGLQGVMDAYNAVFKSGLIMSKPTVFTEVMQTAAARAKEANVTKQAYTVLLILTDGAVSDVQATAACLDQISDAPLSIVIVGVGQADFSAMQFLDDVNNNAAGKRDIAQFVPFHQHAHSSQSLTKATLEEIPDQLVSYFTSREIAPQKAMAAPSDEEIIVEVEDEGECEIDLSLDVGEEEIVVTGGGTAFVDGFRALK